MSHQPHLQSTTLASPLRPHKLVVLLPGLGTDVRIIWSKVVPYLNTDWHVVAFDLPGHGVSAPWGGPGSALTMADLETALHKELHLYREQHRELAGLPLHAAGLSFGGSLTLQTSLSHEIFERAAIICSAARIGTQAHWLARALRVEAEGLEPLVTEVIGRAFGPDFPRRKPATVEVMRQSMCSTDAGSYAALCRILADFDVRGCLSSFSAPLLAVGAEFDVVAPASDTIGVAQRVQQGKGHILAACGHLAPVERPVSVATLLNSFFQ